LSDFWSFFDPILEHQFWTHFSVILRWGVGEVKIIEIWGSENDRFIDFCYIVVSTFFGPSGPPPVHRFWTHFWQKYSLFVGNDIFIGVVFGGPKVWSFCKKVRNFKKFMKMAPRDPPTQNWRFLTFSTPPMAYQILTTFWAIYERHFSTPKSIIFNQFITTSIFDIFGTNFGTIFNAKFQ
jgi:hypothetical protein